MALVSGKILVVKDGKRFYCTVELLTVKGGQNVIYVAEDGTIIKQEPLYRYNNRINRRKAGSIGYTLKV